MTNQFKNAELANQNAMAKRGMGSSAMSEIGSAGNLQALAQNILGAQVQAPGPDWQRVDHQGRLVLPGFIDAHVHSAQIDVLGSWGTELLQWLENRLLSNTGCRFWPRILKITRATSLGLP